MRKNLQRGYTVVELVFAFLFVGWIGVCIWIVSLIIRALMKYVGV